GLSARGLLRRQRSGPLLLLCPHLALQVSELRPVCLCLRIVGGHVGGGGEAGPVRHRAAPTVGVPPAAPLRVVKRALHVNLDRLIVEDGLLFHLSYCAPVEPPDLPRDVCARLT